MLTDGAFSQKVKAPKTPKGNELPNHNFYNMMSAAYYSLKMEAEAARLAKVKQELCSLSATSGSKEQAIESMNHGGDMIARIVRMYYVFLLFLPVFSSNALSSVWEGDGVSHRSLCEYGLMENEENLSTFMFVVGLVQF